MAEYIEREKTISKVRRCRFSGKNLDSHEMSFNDGIYEAAIAIEKIPAADVRPEKYGEWLVSGDCYECSECGGGSVVNTNPYCWKCGAKMDGGKTNEID